MSEGTSRPPLVGLTVLETATYFAGPSASMYLADYGAEVIKVELPEGDPARSQPPRVAGLGTEVGKAFLLCNRGKRSAVVDWRTPEGQRVVDRLIAGADVMVVDAPVGAKTAAWPFHYQRRLRAEYPRLIYAAVSPFGRRGPYVELPPYEPLVQAASGVMGNSRRRNGTHVHAGFRLGESAAGMLLAHGIMMALLAREQTGVGQRVETSMLEAALAMQVVQASWVDNDPTPPSEPAQPTVLTYQCLDGCYINIATIQERQFQALCQVLALEHLLDDPDFSTNAARMEHRAELFGLLDGVLGTRTAAEWLPLLQAAGIPASMTHSRSELFEDQQVLDNHLATSLFARELGRVDMIGSPVMFSETPPSPGRSVPRLGEHTGAVLREAGFSDAEVADLTRARAVWENPREGC